MKKFTHVLITLTFTFACLSLWAMLTMLINVAAHSSQLLPLPGFTRLFLVGRPVLLTLPVPVVAYCLYVIFRRQPTEQSSTTFLAWTMSALCLAFFPVLIAVFLPCLKLMEK